MHKKGVINLYKVQYGIKNRKNQLILNKIFQKRNENNEKND